MSETVDYSDQLPLIWRCACGVRARDSFCSKCGAPPPVADCADCGAACLGGLVWDTTPHYPTCHAAHIAELPRCARCRAPVPLDFGVDGRVCCAACADSLRAR